jgi:hypothetical protein
MRLHPTAALLAAAVLTLSATPSHAVPVLLGQRAMLTAADGAASDHLGRSLAISGDTVIVGAPDAQIGIHARAGAVYVYVLPPGNWLGGLLPVAKLTAASGASLERLGGSVAIFGDTIVAGTDFRRALVFVKPVGGWSGDLTETAELDGGVAGDDFGTAVAISGDTVVVGAGAWDVAGQQGAAYVFAKPGGGWSGTVNPAARLTASDGAVDDWFGFQVAIDGATIVSGASQLTVAGHAGQGEGYVFVEPGGGWSGDLTESERLTSTDGAAGDGLGTTVAIAGTVVALGAPTKTVSGHLFQGAAYVFVEPGGGWAGDASQSAELLASDGAFQAALGSAVAVESGAVLAGSYAKIGTNGGQGAVYRFLQPGGGWAGSLAESDKLVACGGVAGEEMGSNAGSVGLAANFVLAGADGRQVGNNLAQGVAYLFDLDSIFDDGVEVGSLACWTTYFM